VDEIFTLSLSLPRITPKTATNELQRVANFKKKNYFYKNRGEGHQALWIPYDYRFHISTDSFLVALSTGLLKAGAGLGRHDYATV